MRAYHHIVLLLAVCMFLFLFDLGNMALTDPNETFYAQTAKEMFESGKWAIPVVLGKCQFEKPALYYWLILASYKQFGVNEFSARLPSVVFGIAGIIGIYLLARLLFSPLCGLLSGLIMSTCVQYLALARGCVTDMVLMVFILFCLFFFLLAWTEKKKLYYLLSSVMAALAVLTKGPVGLFIPAVIVGLYVATGGRWKELRRVPVVWSVLVFLAVCLPWYIIVMKSHGGAFIEEFFGFHHVTRFLEPEHKVPLLPLLYYIPIIIGGFFPWSAFLPFGARFLYRKDSSASRVESHKLFLAFWFLTVFVFFSIARTKLVTYIFPLFPVMAVVTGRFWENFITDSAEDRRPPASMNISYSIFVFLAVAILTGISFVIGGKYVFIAPQLLLCGTVFLSGTVLSGFFFLYKKKFLAFFAIIFAVIALVFPMVKLVLPVVEMYESSKILAFKVRELAASDEPLGGESDHRYGIAFYSGRTDVEDIHPHSDLVNFVSRKQRVWGIIRLKHYNQFKRDEKDLYLEKVFESGKYAIVTNKPYRREEIL